MTITTTNGFLPQPSSSSLSQVYKSLGQKAIDRAAKLEWPDSTDADRLFATTIEKEEKTYVLPSFPPGEGPLAVAAVLNPAKNQNVGSQAIIAACSQAFEEFVKDLEGILATPELIQEFSSQLVWRVPMGTHHTTVAVFQEHPSLFWKESDKHKCSVVQETEAQQIRQRLSKYFLERDSLHAPPVAPLLQLDSLVLTETGAMIAGFIDVSAGSSSSSFQAIRMACTQQAIAVIGQDRLTSRPKNLIHTTVGRVLALPFDATTQQDQRRNVAQLIRNYNTQILPNVVAKLNQAQQGSFPLTHVTMMREIVWTMQEFHEYQTWTLMDDGNHKSN